MIPGCDVSSYQDSNATPRRVDFQQMKAAGAEFVFIRAAFGITPDEDFAYNWQAAKDAGLLRGAYCFYNYWAGAAKASKQISVWMDLLADDSGEIPPAIDVECPNEAWRPHWTPLPRATVLDTIWQFHHAVCETRLQRSAAILYTNPAGIFDKLTPAQSWLLEMPLWIANWYVPSPSFKPWGTWHFWQHGLGKGRGPGYGTESLDVDLDYWNGDLSSLRRFCGMNTEPEPDDTTVLTLDERVARLEKLARENGWNL